MIQFAGKDPFHLHHGKYFWGSESFLVVEQNSLFLTQREPYSPGIRKTLLNPIVVTCTQVKWQPVSLSSSYLTYKRLTHQPKYVGFQDPIDKPVAPTITCSNTCAVWSEHSDFRGTVHEEYTLQVFIHVGRQNHTDTVLMVRSASLIAIVAEVL